MLNVHYWGGTGRGSFLPLFTGRLQVDLLGPYASFSGLRNCPTNIPLDGCYESAASGATPGDPPPFDPDVEKMKDIVVIAQKSRRDSNGKKIPWGAKEEQGYIVTTTSVAQIPTTSLPEVDCGNGTIITQHRMRPPPGSTVMHTHLKRYKKLGKVPGPGDGGAAMQAASMTTTERVFTIEYFPNGTFRTTVSGPPLNQDEGQQLVDDMALWESPNATSSTATPQQKYCH